MNLEFSYNGFLFEFFPNRINDIISQNIIHPIFVTLKKINSINNKDGILTIPGYFQHENKPYIITAFDYLTFNNNFLKRKNIKEINIPTSINWIISFCISNFSNLERINFYGDYSEFDWIKDYLLYCHKSIDSCAFSDLPKLKEITIPNYFEEIDKNFIFDCENLSVIKLKNKTLIKKNNKWKINNNLNL